MVVAAVTSACGAGGPAAKPPVQKGGTADAAAAPQPAMKLADALAPKLGPGSPVVERRAHADWSACHASPIVRGDAAKVVAQVALACAGATKLKPSGASISGSLTASDPAMSFPLRAEAGQCYRVYASAAAELKHAVFIVRDQSSRAAAEYRIDELDGALAPDEALCFREAQNATIVVSAGLGSGAFAVQVWGDAPAASR